LLSDLVVDCALPNALSFCFSLVFLIFSSSRHFDLLPLHCYTDHLCPPSSPLGRSTTAPQAWNCLGTSTRSANTFSSFRRCLKSKLFAAAYDTWASYYPPSALLIRMATRRYTNLSRISNLSAYTFVMCKMRATYLVTYLICLELTVIQL